MKFAILLFVSLLILIVSSSLAEDISKPEKSFFVDLDGDGLDDNVRDLDSDGIPDFGDKAAYQREEAITTVGTGIFQSIQSDPINPKIFNTNSQRFSDLKCCTLSLAQSRGGFGATDDFSSLGGSGQGSGGGNCSGGICH